MLVGRFLLTVSECLSYKHASDKLCQHDIEMRVGTKPGLWTLDTGLDSALDYDLDNGLDYGLNLGRNWTVIVFQLCHVKLAMNARLHNKWRNIKTGIYACSF